MEIYMTKQQLLAKLGYTERDRLLIIHSDDFGMCHSANVGTMQMLTEGVGTSASLLLPCPWAHEALAFWQQHPELSIGVEICLTSEWEKYRWGPLSSTDHVPSLFGKDGCFYSDGEQFNKQARFAEVEIESRAQIERVLSLGLQPTHLICHMDVLRLRPEFQRLFLALVIEYRLPARYPELELAQPWPVNEDCVAIDSHGTFPIELREKEIYAALRKMKPGIHEIFGHCSVDAEELRATTNFERRRQENPDSWRLRVHDTDLFCSHQMRQFLDDAQIYCISWGQIRNVIESGPDS